MSRMDKKEDKEKEKDTTLSYLKNVYMENIPMEALQDPDLPKKYRYQLGFIAYAVMGFLFLYSLVTNFQTALKEKYMSFESDSGNCKTVERPLTGTFKMDYYGNWEGSVLYQPNQAIYEVEFNRLLVDEASFRNQMLEIDKYIIQPFVEYANWLPLYYILLYHMGHERYINVNGNKQVFRFNGYPKRIYQAENFFGGVASSSVQGCNFAGESSLYLGSGFEYESGKLYVQYDYQLYLNSSKCMGALDTSQIITNPFSSPRELKFEVSVESLIIADAVNKMLIPFENMIQATSERYDFPYYDGYNYTYTSWYYPRYPDMEPIWCVLGVWQENMLNDSSIYDPMDIRWSGRVLPPFLCVIKWIDTMTEDGSSLTHYFFPLFQHMFPGCQSCPSRETYTVGLEQAEGAGICHHMYFFTSLIYFTGSSNSSVLNMASYWFMKNDSGGANSWAASMGMATNGASWAAVWGGAPDGFDDLQHDTRDFPYGTNYSDMFSFCRGDCSVISIGSVNNDFVISKDYFALREGACRDSMSTPNWEKFTVPPQPLVEPYYSCTQTTWDAFNDALGIASGFAASLGGVALLLLLPCVYLFKEDKEDEEEGHSKDALMSKLGDLLVEAENKRRITSSGLDIHDVMKLMSELTEPQPSDGVAVALEADDDRHSLAKFDRRSRDPNYSSSVEVDDKLVDSDELKNIVTDAQSSSMGAPVVNRSRRATMNDLESPLSSSAGFNRPRDGAGIISSKVRRLSMSGGKLMLQDKDSDDEEEINALFDDSNIRNDNDHEGRVSGESKKEKGIENVDMDINARNGTHRDVTTDDVRIQILGESKSVVLAPGRGDVDDFIEDTNDHNDEGGEYEEHLTVGRSASDSDYLQLF